MAVNKKASATVNMKEALGFLLAGVLAASFMNGAAAAEQHWKPDGPVTLVVPYSAGGGTDTVGRIIARKLSEHWDRAVLVENRAGANGVIGGAMVARAKPDGRTFMLAVSSIAINPYVMPNVPADPSKDFTPITMLGHSTVVMVARPDLPEKSLAEFVKAAKAAPGTRTFASTEPSSRLYGESLKELAGIDILNVPYKGGSQLMTDVMGGQVDTGFTSIASALPFLSQGKMKMLAVASAKRSPLLPGVPTFMEEGVNLPPRSWLGIFGPAGMSAETVQGVFDGVAAAVQDPEVEKSLSLQAVVPAATPPSEFQRFFSKQLKENRQLVERAGLLVPGQ